MTQLFGLGATAFATDSAFADGKKKHGKSQAIAQANECGNGKMPMYVYCQNTGSQIQGEDNSVAISSNQGEQERGGHGGGGNGGGHGGGGNGGGHGGGHGGGDYEDQ